MLETLSSVIEYGHLFATGTPVSFSFSHNTGRSGYFGSTFGQDIEPAGMYIQHVQPSGSPPRGWIVGVAHVDSPLVVPISLDMDHIYGPFGWKAVLSRAFSGLTGKRLSRAILKDGYDAVITTDGEGTREIVLLDPSK
jgi:hypothetical protein